MSVHMDIFFQISACLCSSLGTPSISAQMTSIFELACTCSGLDTPSARVHMDIHFDFQHALLRSPDC